MPTPMTANKGEDVVVPAYSLMSNPTKNQRSRERIDAGKDTTLKNNMLYPRKNARMEPPRYAPDSPKTGDQRHTDQIGRQSR